MVWRVQNYFSKKSIEHKCLFFDFLSKVHHRWAREEDTQLLALEKLSIFHRSASNITHSSIATQTFSMHGRLLHCTLRGLVQCSTHCSVQCSTKNIQLKVLQIICTPTDIPYRVLCFVRSQALYYVSGRRSRIYSVRLQLIQCTLE